MSHGTINRAWTNLQASENVSSNSNPIYINVASKYKKSAIDPVHYGSHVRLTGFEFCKHLENSTFDSSVHLDQFKGSIQTAQPSLSSVVDMIESAALEFTFTVISQLDRKQAILPVDLKRFVCYSAAMGKPMPSLNFKGITKSTFLVDVDHAAYFKDIVPNLYKPAETENLFKKKYSLAYFIMVHKQEGFENLKLLVEKLNDNDAIILIHVDDKSKSLKEKVKSWIAEIDNVHLSTKSYDGRWGHSSLVHMQLYGLFELFDIADWDYVINLSNYDWPMMSNQQIYKYLDDPTRKGKTWVNHWKSEEEMNIRIQDPHMRLKSKKGGIMDQGVTRFEGDRTLPFNGWKTCKHHQWATYTRDFVSYIRKDKMSMNALAFFEFTFVPDESYFCTIIINNSELNTKNVNDNKRYHNFNGGAHPIWLTMENKGNLKYQIDDNAGYAPFEPKYLFIRKVDASKNQKFLNWLNSYPGITGFSLFVISLGYQ